MAARRDRKDALLEAGLTLASELSLPIVLQRIVDIAIEITDARYGALGVVGENGRLTDFVTTGISAKQRRAIGDPPHGRGVLGLLIRVPRPVRMKNIADHKDSVGFPANHPPMHSFLGAPVQAMGRVYGNIYLAEKRGATEFSLEDERALIILATQAGVAIANASLYDETRRRQRWLEALRGITNDILAGRDADSLLVDIAEHARELAGASLAIIASATETPGELTVNAAAGANASALHGQTLPEANSISGEVMRTGRPLVVADAGADSRAFAPIITTGRVGPAIFVPIHAGGRVSGTMMVANLKGGRPFDEVTVNLVETFAAQASIAVEYARGQVQLRRMGLMEERERIAKELHDGIIQSLFAVGMGLQGAAIMAGSTDIAARIEGAVGELDKVIRDLRNYIFGLRPGILADRQLDGALRSLGEELEARSGIQVRMEVDPMLAATLSAQSHEIVQLTREALSNVARHSKATSVTVRLARDSENAQLTIADNGVGFVAGSRSAGNGLRNMRGRATALGGTLRVDSARRKGTTLLITFPNGDARVDGHKNSKPSRRSTARPRVGR